MCGDARSLVAQICLAKETLQNETTSLPRFDALATIRSRDFDVRPVTHANVWLVRSIEPSKWISLIPVAHDTARIRARLPIVHALSLEKDRIFVELLAKRLQTSETCHHPLPLTRHVLSQLNLLL